MTFKSPKVTLEAKRMSMVLDEDERLGIFYPRSCPANIEQMTIREYLYCKRHYWGGWYIKYTMQQSLSEFADATGVLLSNIVCLLFWPITVIIAAKKAINRDKKYCEKWRPKQSEVLRNE